MDRMVLMIPDGLLPEMCADERPTYVGLAGFGVGDRSPGLPGDLRRIVADSVT
jgi:hypothetical protein